MKTNKISLVGYVIGVVAIAIAVYRYSGIWLYEDLGRLFMWGMISVSWIGTWFNYDNARRDRNVTSQKIENIDDVMQEIMEK